MFTISKEFELNIGHRIFTQKFDYDMTESKNQPRSCLHNHGHGSKFIVSL